MDFKAEYEIDKGPVVRWFADRLMQLSGWLMKIALPYATLYTVTLDEDELES